MRDVARGAGRVHLFQSVPNGLALMLGHIWNRLPDTLLYADLNPGYVPTFAVRG
jgi:hypothetical protein